METEQKKKVAPKILIVDDISINVQILKNIIQSEGYEALCALSVKEALDIMKETMPQLILSDLSMPDMTGLDFCNLLKSNLKTRNIPFIFITVADSKEEKKAAFAAGAVDFIPKPFEPTEVIMRMNNQLNLYRINQEMEEYNRLMHRMVADQKKQMEKERENVLLSLAKVVERRNTYIAGHLDRVANNVRLLAQSLQLASKYEDEITDEFINIIPIASRLHDIGNIVMSDALLSGEGDVETDESEIIRFRVEEGAKILEDIRDNNSKSHFFDMAIVIARYHHAHWDGSGYPFGIEEEEIPVAARITAVVNDFDMFVNKQGDGSEQAVQYAIQKINENSAKLYDPHIVEVFNKVIKQMKIK